METATVHPAPSGPVADYFQWKYGTVPIPQALHPIACRLAELWYTEGAISRAIEHISRFGTAQCALDVDPEHRDQIEVLIPPASETEWTLFDHIAIGLGAGTNF